MNERLSSIAIQAAAAAFFFSGCHAQAQPQPEPAGRLQAKQAFVAKRQVVVAAHPLAAEAGHAMLKLGGSALDAAIAAQMVLNLVEPQSSGIGGGAFLLVWSAKDQRLYAYDGRESAPAAARADRFLDGSGQPLAHLDAVANGRSVGVPGVLAALELAHRRHGKLAWREPFQRAILHAAEGYAMPERLHALLEWDGALREVLDAKDIYFDAAGRPRPVGSVLKNPALAGTLRRIALGGARAFYEGEIAQDIVKAVASHGRPGDLTERDLAAYRAIEREPLCGAYRSWRVCGMPPPSSGGVAVLQMLGILERTDFARAAPNSVDAVHLFSEAGRLAYADRNRYVADPAFVPQPLAGLLAPEYLTARAALIGARSMGVAQPGAPQGALAWSDVPAEVSAGTSHISVVDAEGNAVAMTTSIEYAFGSRIFVRGFLLNNQLTDFAFVPESAGRLAANRVEPGKRPRSSMAPTMVFDRAGRLQIVLGSPGGSGIINYIAKTLVATLDWGMEIQEAIASPNFGSSNGPTLIERETSYEDLGDALAERGHILKFTRLTSGLHGIERVPEGWRAGADPRREGVARGE